MSRLRGSILPIPLVLPVFLPTARERFALARCVRRGAHRWRGWHVLDRGNGPHLAASCRCGSTLDWLGVTLDEG